MRNLRVDQRNNRLKIFIYTRISSISPELFITHLQSNAYFAFAIIRLILFTRALTRDAEIDLNVYSAKVYNFKSFLKAVNDMLEKFDLTIYFLPPQ